MEERILPSSATDVVLGYGPMDTIHAEFDALVRTVLAATDDDFHASLLPLVAHLHSHFAEEDAWMRETDFPPRDCHMDEHAAVLRSAAEVEPLVAAGQVAVGRAFVAELARWFPGHADYLDSALAAWMCKRRFGGKPVVLQRRSEGRA